MENTLSCKLACIGDRMEQAALLPRFKTIIDVGGQPSTSWAGKLATHFVDINAPTRFDAGTTFVGNLSMPYLWDQILDYVDEHGKFDYSVCTHVIEDLANPKLVCDMLGRISKRGFIAVPSKYVECRRFEGHWRGFIHHRWIYDLYEGKLTAWPKIGYMNGPEFDALVAKHDYYRNSELQIQWEGSIDLQLINGDYLGPDLDAIYEIYAKLFEDRV